MKVLELTKATAPLATYAQKVNKEPVILTDCGKPIAALVSLDDADLETASLSTNPRFLALIERSRARMKSEGGVLSHEMRRRLGLKQTGRRR